MPGKPSTGSAKNASIKKQGHTASRRYGSNPSTASANKNPREISPKG